MSSRCCALSEPAASTGSFSHRSKSPGPPGRRIPEAKASKTRRSASPGDRGTFVELRTFSTNSSIAWNHPNTSFTTEFQATRLSKEMSRLFDLETLQAGILKVTTVFVFSFGWGISFIFSCTKRVAVINRAKKHKHRRRKRQSVTAKREKSQTPKFITAILT